MGISDGKESEYEHWINIRVGVFMRLGGVRGADQKKANSTVIRAKSSPNSSKQPRECRPRRLWLDSS
jgi:hypothetical protein